MTTRTIQLNKKRNLRAEARRGRMLEVFRLRTVCIGLAVGMFTLLSGRWLAAGVGALGFGLHFWYFSGPEKFPKGLKVMIFGKNSEAYPAGRRQYAQAYAIAAAVCLACLLLGGL